MRLATVGVANLCGFVLTGAQQHTESSAAFRVDSSARSSLISLSRSLLLVLNSASNTLATTAAADSVNPIFSAPTTGYTEPVRDRTRSVSPPTPQA